MSNTQFHIREQPCIGVSRCLLGEDVRYDGGNKRQAWLVNDLARQVEIIPVCPEVAIGLGVPRPPLHLVCTPGGVRALGVSDPRQDVTDDMQRFSVRLLADQPALDGWIFKSGSPSCGVTDVPVVNPDGNSIDTGSGLFAAEIMKALPLLPVADEQELLDPLLRDCFIERMFVYRHYRRWFASGLTTERMHGFHRGLRGHLLARGEQTWAGLQQADIRLQDPVRDIPAYLQQVMRLLKIPVSKSGLAQALLALGREVPAGDRNIAAGISDYLAGRIDLHTVVTQLRKESGIEYCFLLNPEPAEAALRYGVVTTR
jgi:uncharacterized protein YbbK (DUF523 family)/uncharacterized protein YbgA (DUF1722 family)